MTEATPIHIAAGPVPGEPDPVRVADRYEIEQLIGRGGMASVYRARDIGQQTTVALKLLFAEGGGAKVAKNVELFEREFHTLVQLAHPRVVRALDYGVDGKNPYYTMELLDGGDLQQLAPMSWQELCTVAYEICSVLSLLHSRRLVHRDLTPRNIRRTTDGKAKLIDFGLLSPMGPAGLIAGTPPFVPPEMLHNTSLDGRSDLFSLGATLYSALTGRLAYRARRFDQLPDAWRTSPVSPSQIVPGVPAALEEILLAMLRIDAGSRPKSAAEVMDRLLPLLAAAPDDELRAARAYLTVPRLVGRDQVVVQFRRRVVDAMRRRGGGFVIDGAAGAGRSRMIDAFALEAKLSGSTTLRAGAKDGTRPFGVAAALAAQLYAASPGTSLQAAEKDRSVYAVLFGEGADRASEGSNGDAMPARLADITRSDTDRAVLQASLRSWLLEFSSKRPLAIAIDDIDRIDEPSAALFSSLTWEAPGNRFAYAVSLERGSAGTAPTALSIIRKHAKLVELEPLGPEETTALLGSVFGDTANLQLLSRTLHGLCGGLPRECMTLAEFLVDQGAITYAGGSWTLPSEIAEGMLPRSVEETLARKISARSPAALRLAAFLALALAGRLSRAELMRIDGMSASAVDGGIDELLEAQVINGDTSGYALQHRNLANLVISRLTDAERAQTHQELARIHDQSGAHLLAVAYHELLGQKSEHGLERILSRAGTTEQRSELSMTAAVELGTDGTAKTLDIALAEAERLQTAQRDRQSLWVMLAGVSAQGEDAGYYYRVPPEWLAQLKQDSGWNDWQKLDPNLEPPARAMMAVGAAAARYGETPEADRVLAPMDAIKQLVSYVVFSIAVSVRVLDLKLMASLPELLEPFTPLNPMVLAMRGNAIGTLLNGVGKREAARAAFLQVLDQLDDISGAELAYVEKVRASLCQTMGEIDASLGVRSAFIDRLDSDVHDPNQLVGARYVRKVVALQQGDWEGAERHRQQAELLTLQNKARPMFSTLGQELEVHAMARDLTGLKQVRAAIHAMAEQHPGWAPVRHVADAHYLALCGELEGALAAIREARTSGTDGAVHSPWVLAAAAVEAEILVDLGRAEEALPLGIGALEECEREGMRYLARGLASAVALAEARLGRFDQATPRADAVIAEQIALGVTGLQLGLSYQRRARIAVWHEDRESFEKFSKLAAEQYRPGESSVLGALYERLMEEARRSGVGDLGWMPMGEASATLRMTESFDHVTTALSGCTRAGERAERALSLLCDGEPPARGHLFLMTDRGLALAASNAPCASPSDLASFARRCLETEIDQASVETSAGATAAMEDEEAAGRWSDSDGTIYGSLLLGAQIGDTYRLTGVAVLTESGPRRVRNLGQLAEAIARNLIDAGISQSVSAA